MLSNATDEDIRSICFESLRRLRKDEIPQEISFVGESVRIAIERKLAVARNQQEEGWLSHKKIDPVSEMRFRDEFWNLIIEGIIRPSAIGQSEQFPWFHVTKRGLEVIHNINATPYEHDKYVERIVAACESDEIVIEYTIEAIQALRQRLILSCVIATGVASEHVYKLFLRHLAASMTDDILESRLHDVSEGLSIQKAFELYQKVKPSLITAIKADKSATHLSHNIDTYLDHIALNIRSYRNDAGHAKKTDISESAAYAHLMIFPDYLERVYSLISWLRTHQKSI